MTPTLNKILDIQDAMVRILNQNFPYVNYLNERDLRKQNRMLLDMNFFLSVCLRVLPANSHYLMKAQIALDGISRTLLERNTFIQTLGFNERMLGVIEYDAPWTFREVGEMVTHINRMSDKLSLEELIMTGQLFTIFNSSKPQLDYSRTYSGLIDRTHNLFCRARMTQEGYPLERDMELDGTTLRVREWIMNEFREIDNDITSRNTDEWCHIAINKANVIFSAAALVYVRRSSYFPHIKEVCGGIHPDMLYNIEGG